MPLPFILGAAAAAAAAFGVKKGYDAHSDNKKADELLERAERYYERAKDELEDARSEATATLERWAPRSLRSGTGSWAGSSPSLSNCTGLKSAHPACRT